MSEEFEVRNGVRQGDSLSSVLFSLVVDKVIRDAEINRSGLLYYKRHQCLAFADDLVILARNKKELKEVIKRLEEQSVKRGLRINEKKTKYMQMDRRRISGGKVFKRKKYEFEEVEQFTYLGSIFSRKLNIEEEKEAKIMAGNK
ncbi:hypothetical protein NQ315_013856, partial [Exocentrus adspersus]